MAELHDLKPAQGSRQARKRVGRGPGSGVGKTSGRGHKGQKARSGGTIAPGFEGGQMPLQRRIPKRGFTPLDRVRYQVVNVRDLSKLGSDDVTPGSLAAGGLVGSSAQRVKILGTGEVDRAYTVRVHAISAGARAKIEAAGGSVALLGDASQE